MRERERERERVPLRNQEKRFPWKLYLYVPASEQALVDEVSKIVEREGRSLSQLFIEFAREYQRKHGHGNPQMRIDSPHLAAEPVLNWCVDCREFYCPRHLREHLRIYPHHKAAHKLPAGGSASCCWPYRRCYEPVVAKPK